MSLATDVHQHLWPEPLLAALARRRRPPQLRRDGRRWTLLIAGEREWPVDLADHDVEWRARLVAADGLDRALVALSSPLGVEALPGDEARDLIDAWHAAADELPAALPAWAAASLDEPDAPALARQLDRGRVGLCLPALALAGLEGVARCAPLLDLLEQRGAPLLVHPGPAPWRPSPAPGPGDPGWWPALTSYVAQMQAAWLAFRVWARPAHPRLRACFAMLAGLAPLQAERAASRGVDLAAADPGVFLDTSSYGPAAITAIAAVAGAGALVHGSDRPVVAPPPPAPGAARADPIRAANPARLLSSAEVYA